MKIGVDTSILEIDRAGAGVYTRELVKHLQYIDAGVSYEFFSPGASGAKRGYFSRKVKNILTDTLWMQFKLPRELKRRGIDLLHCTAFRAPLKRGFPLVVTFYDLHILKSPLDYNPWLRYYCKFMLPKIAKRADKIITISEFSKNDIINTFSISPEKVAVTYCGIDNRFRLIPGASLKNNGLDKYGIKEKFILYVGALQPRKNIPLLLKAYSKLLKERFFDYQLVLVSATGWRNKDIFSLVNDLGLKDDIKILGYVPDDDLPLIYNLAQFLVYPSFFEGFGLPILEAMACGCPVICSSATSLPEIAGDCAVMFDPFSQIQLENAMRKMTTENNMRVEMSGKGIGRAADFSWEKCARLTLEVYKECKR